MHQLISHEIGRKGFLFRPGAFVTGCCGFRTFGALTESAVTQCRPPKPLESVHQSDSVCRPHSPAVFPPRLSRYSFCHSSALNITKPFFFLFFFIRPEYEQKERQSAKQETTSDDAEFPHKLRNFSIAALLAALAMIVYATSTGIIQVIINRNTLLV